MDSTTLLYQLLQEKKEVKAISFNYGQRHSRELEQAKATCEKLGVEHKIIDLSFYKELASNSALTGNIDVPHGHYEGENMKLTVVPNRNMVMASIAIGLKFAIAAILPSASINSGRQSGYIACERSL